MAKKRTSEQVAKLVARARVYRDKGMNIKEACEKAGIQTAVYYAHKKRQAKPAKRRRRGEPQTITYEHKVSSPQATTYGEGSSRPMIALIGSPEDVMAGINRLFE